ncbi:hypothetical protein [Hymenobacter metallicola]|uniref:hypothetical protein n=1 Tax=Hymenobacter metallicola TaxID=2563114 RepID=UPI0014367516|nr:hypothetical protein [Hymenobacter metallicola]
MENSFLTTTNVANEQVTSLFEVEELEQRLETLSDLDMWGCGNYAGRTNCPMEVEVSE